jgi:hypothetical protein
LDFQTITPSIIVASYSTKTTSNYGFSDPTPDTEAYSFIGVWNMNGGKNTDFDLSLSIAGINVQLAFSGDELLNKDRIRQDYSGFAANDLGSPSKIKIQVEGGENFPLIPGGTAIRIIVQDGRIKFYSEFENGWLDLDAKYGELIIRPTGSPENYLRVLYAIRCLERDALLVHASGVVRRGLGYVFFGASGSGKTTVTSLSSGAIILSDDLVILQYEEGDTPSVRVFGVPFRGELADAPRANTNAQVKGLYSLVKDKDHFITPVKKPEAIARLAGCVPFVMFQPENADRVLRLCQKIVYKVPVVTLHFRPDPGFWSLIDG